MTTFGKAAAGVIGGLAILTGIALRPLAAERPVAKGTAPYALDMRPAPTGTDLERLLPMKIGDFTRPAFPPGTKPKSDEDLNIDYTSGKDSVNVGFSIPDSMADAHEAIKVSRDEGKASGVDMARASFSIDTEPAWFKSPDFIAWSRGRYFFYAKASTPVALDRFMRAFPW
jgi:hypothetical protein